MLCGVLETCWSLKTNSFFKLFQILRTVQLWIQCKVLGNIAIGAHVCYYIESYGLVGNLSRIEIYQFQPD